MSYAALRGTVLLAVRISFGAFLSDRRGDKLASYRLARSKAGGHFILMRGSEAVARQVERLVKCERQKVPIAMTVEFTHCLRLDSPPDDDLEELLTLLRNIVTIPLDDEVDCALALDFYKDPATSEDPMQWENTAAGELVHRGKYHGEVAKAKELADQLAEVIMTHPLFSKADAILSVPGHQKDVPSFGVRLAKGVAKRTGKQFIKTGARSSDRPASKEGDQRDVEALKNEFEIPVTLDNLAVIIVDDVIRSGTSMRAVAIAARTEGAKSVLGLAGVRTMRR